MHLHSGVHRGYEIQCPFCQCHRATAAGLTHHIETGSCPRAAGVTRDTLYRLIRSNDPQGTITNNLLGWSGSTQYEANELAYNRARRGWECYLCHRVFDRLPVLNRHLNSPIHQESLYHCPNRQCGKEFTVLAGIINHLESESCGYMRFEDVQRDIHNVVGGSNLLSF
ncbi:uncharacterized protein JN550_013199 [Neoarthrinium moseri]|uniref:uncharacterized protein n=1 Tax=Neoarthrinium moseri TaxID=1658444 RepID=UPI001FDCB9EB|nr:uncharacterized protein JN550_013199 [Neoarthrinium moseri]KAI1857566.1 hypothetical protein JN550_013199 [Neoarthrinium moseri]